MSSRDSFAPAIAGRVAALGALFAGRRSSEASPSRADMQRKPVAPAAGKPQAHPRGVSINHLPCPSELPGPGLDKTG